jgi:hypothetical protein
VPVPGIHNVASNTAEKNGPPSSRWLSMDSKLVPGRLPSDSDQ